jgi:protein SCO1/2
MSKRLIRIAILSIPTLIVAAIVAYISLPDRTAGPNAQSQVVASSPEIGGPFTMVDHTGQEVASSDMQGEFMLLFFGFTYCPDICPQELSTISRVLDQLGDDAEDLNALFVSIDPERDTPEAMADFVDLFHPDITGLTGSPEQVEEIASAYRVFYQRVENDRFEEYTMDHSTFTYLMGPDGENLGIFPIELDAETMTASIRTLMNESL